MADTTTLNREYQLVATTDQLEWLDAGASAGCYYVTNVDAYGAESAASDEVCVEDGPACAGTGDVNGDGNADVLDIVSIVGYILDGEADFEIECGDINGDGNADVLDIVVIVNLILGVGTGNHEFVCSDIGDGSSCSDYFEKGSITQWYTSIGMPIIPFFDIHLSYRSITSKNVEVIKGSQKGSKSDLNSTVTGVGIAFNF